MEGPLRVFDTAAAAKAFAALDPDGAMLQPKPMPLFGTLAADMVACVGVMGGEGCIAGGWGAWPYADKGEAFAALEATVASPKLRKAALALTGPPEYMEHTDLEFALFKVKVNHAPANDGDEKGDFFEQLNPSGDS